jgi:hypothetical protein
MEAPEASATLPTMDVLLASCAKSGRARAKQSAAEDDQRDAGIFIDKKTDMKRLFLKTHGASLDADKVKYVMGNKGQKYIYLRKYSQKNFAFIDISELLKAHDANLKVSEQDVNWAIHEYRKHKTLDNKDWLAKWLAPMLFGFAAIALVILVAFIFQKFDVLQTTAQTINSAAEALRQAAQQLAAAKSGTQIIP